MLGNCVQISLQSSLPFCNELPVHVSNELLRREREGDAAHLKRRTEKRIHIFINRLKQMFFLYIGTLHERKITVTVFSTVLLHAD